MWFMNQFDVIIIFEFRHFNNAKIEYFILNFTSWFDRGFVFHHIRVFVYCTILKSKIQYRWNQQRDSKTCFWKNIFVKLKIMMIRMFEIKNFIIDCDIFSFVLKIFYDLINFVVDKQQQIQIWCCFVLLNIFYVKIDFE